MLVVKLALAALALLFAGFVTLCVFAPRGDEKEKGFRPESTEHPVRTPKRKSLFSLHRPRL